ncbi:DExH-box splicing factor binding site-domain-containing protein [Xylaria sp. FL1777]|nr:DExH-box splicing factor binding site-domain-containing protein [Xylaria sp. FL1777]
MSDSPSQPPASRIAIKFGASSLAGSKTSSNATNGRGKSQPSSTLGKRQRPNVLYHDSDSGDDDDTASKHEAITTISANTTLKGSDVPSGAKQNKDYVISSQKNRDWKADVKTRRGDRATPQHLSSTKNHNLDTAPADQDKDIKWGLNVTKKSIEEGSSNADNESQEQEKDISNATTISQQLPRDVDRDAIDALLGKRNPAQDLIIKDSVGTSKPQFSEQDAYQRSMTEAAEVSTIEEYSKIPEGEFGAAMLRGMGWNGEEFGSKPKEVKRRPHLMGLGSKEDEEIRKAELAKRHGHRERRPRLDEYRRDREKEKQERNGRYKDSYKSERERERREHSYDHRSRDRYRDRDDRGHR